MKPIPQKYRWLKSEPGPRMLIQALRLYGIEETQGPGNTPEILAWARELGGNTARVYTEDRIPWCGLFVAIVAVRAGKTLPASPLWARTWSSWGNRSPRAQLGDVLVFMRTGGSHVGLYVGEDREAYHVLGGNQADSVRISRIQKGRLIDARREYRLGAPDNVRVIALNGEGAMSRNEA